MRKSLFVKYFFVFVLIFFFNVRIQAQDDPGGPGNSDPGGIPSGWVPIDRGLGLLLTAGIAYGIKKKIKS